MARPNWLGIGKTVNQHGKERVYGGARNEGRDCVDALAFALRVNTKKFNKEIEEAKMAITKNKPAVELDVDRCGRYHFATAFVYVEEQTKHKGRLREQIVGYGVARRQHGDHNDEYVGEGLAVSRALEDVGYKLAKRALGRVKHNDDIKVMRRQQKERRQAKAEQERSVYQKITERFKVVKT